MRFARTALALLLAACLPLAPRADAAQDSLARDIDAILDAPEFRGAFWGVLAVSLDSGRVLYARNADKGFMPASAMKMFPAAAALCELGPDWQYTTRLMATDADTSDGVVDGDLVVVGSGDVSFTPRFHDGDALAPFEEWAEALKARGVRTVEGRIVGDDDAFDDEPLARGWQHDYLDDWYAAETGALCLNDNCIDVSVRPAAAPGAPPLVSLYPGNGYIELRNEALTCQGDRVAVDADRPLNDRTVRLFGRIGLRAQPQLIYVSVPNPTLFFCHHLRRALIASGIQVAGGIADIDDLDKREFRASRLHEIARTVSPSLKDIAGEMLRKSQNLYAEQMLKTLGAHKKGHGSARNGRRAILEFLKRIGVDTSGLRIYDGSGLSRLNLVRPRHLTSLLAAMRKHPQGAPFIECLPAAGSDDALLRRFGGPAFKGRMQAKTGHIMRVLSIAGYLTTDSGEELALAIMLNNYTTSISQAIAAQNAVCKRLALDPSP